MKTKNRVLTCAVLLSLVGGGNCAAAVVIDAKETVTKGGTYNSIIVTGEDATGVNGNGSLELIMEGEQKIIVEAKDKKTKPGEKDQDAKAIGVRGAHLQGNALDLKVTSTAGTGAITEGTDNIVKANAVAKGVEGLKGSNNIITGNITITSNAQGNEVKITKPTNGFKSDQFFARSTAEGIGLGAYDASNTIKGNINITATAQGGVLTTNDITTDKLTMENEAGATAKGLQANLSGSTINSVDGNAQVKVTATGGTATVKLKPEQKYSKAIANVWANANAAGLDANAGSKNTITGATNIEATATGGTATSQATGNTVLETGNKTEAHAGAEATATGLVATQDATNSIGTPNTTNTTHTIVATAQGGSATAVGEMTGLANANANAAGLDAGTGGKNLVYGDTKMNVKSTAGSASVTYTIETGNSSDLPGNAKASAVAVGLRAITNGSNEIQGNVDLTVEAFGGTASSDTKSLSAINANVTATGLLSASYETGNNDGGRNKITGDAVLRVKAQGGAKSEIVQGVNAMVTSQIYAYGLSTVGKGNGGANVIGGNADITVEAIGGKIVAENLVTEQGTVQPATLIVQTRAYGLAAQPMDKITNKTGGSNTIDGSATINVRAKGAQVVLKKISNDSSLEVEADGLAAAYGGTNEIKGQETNFITVAAEGVDFQSNTPENVLTADKMSVQTDAYGLNARKNGSNSIEGDTVLKVSARGARGAFTTDKIWGSNVTANAYGLRADGDGSNTIDGNAQIIVSAQGGSVTWNKGGTTQPTNTAISDANAYGLYADKGTNKITGNVTIKTHAETTMPGAGSVALSMFAKGAGAVNDLSSKGTVKQLEGDIRAIKNGTNLLTLDTAASYLQGNITTTKNGTNTVIVANGATWRPVYDARYENANGPDPAVKVDERSVAALTLEDGGIVDLTWDGWNEAHTEYDTAHTNRLNNGYRTMTIDNLSGGSSSSEEQPDGIFRLDSDLAKGEADKVTIGADSTATNVKIQINYDAFYGSSTKKDEVLNGKAIVVTDESGKLHVSGGENIHNENTFLVTVEQDQENAKDWLLTGLKNLTGIVGANINTKTAAASRYALNSLWLAETNSLHKRVGDLRLEKTTAEGLAHRDGLWAKYGHGTLQNGSGSAAELQYNQFQIGYDKAFTMAGGQVYRGVTLSRITGDTAYAGGSGEASSTTLGLYQAWLGDTGHYYDIVLKHGKLTNDYKVVTSADSGDYSAWGTTLSGEYGYRQALSHGAYFEPQAEVIFGHVGGADYTTANGMQVNLDSTNHAIARLGFALGQEFTGGNAFVQANYYHDFAGGGGVTTGVVGYEREQAKNWYELGLGGTVQLSDSTNAYAEINKYFGDTKSNLVFNVGVRYSF